MYISTVGLFISSQYKSGVEVSELPAGRARPSHMYFVAQSQSCVVAAGWNQFARQRNPRLFVMQWSLHWPSLAWPELEPEHEQLLHPSEITDAVGFQTNYATI